MVMDGSYTCECNITYRLVQSLGYISKVNVAFCVKYTSIKKKFIKIRGRQHVEVQESLP